MTIQSARELGILISRVCRQRHQFTETSCQNLEMRLSKDYEEQKIVRVWPAVVHVVQVLSAS